MADENADATPSVPATRSLRALRGHVSVGPAGRELDQAVRGRAIESDLASFVTATIHPAAILRAPDDAAREAQRAGFTEDLAFAARHLAARRDA